MVRWCKNKLSSEYLGYLKKIHASKNKIKKKTLVQNNLHQNKPMD